jgi:hypothetical protein
MVAERHQIALGVQPCGKAVPACGAIVIVAQIVGAVEQDLDRLARHGLGHLAHHDHIVIEQPSPKSAADTRLVDGDILALHAQHGGGIIAAIVGGLTGRPDFQLAIDPAARAILRLQRAMGKEGIGVIGADRLGGARQGFGRIAILGMGHLRPGDKGRRRPCRNPRLRSRLGLHRPTSL